MISFCRVDKKSFKRTFIFTDPNKHYCLNQFVKQKYSIIISFVS